MVANAHQIQEEEGRKVSDIVYLVGVFGMILAVAPLVLVLLYTEQGIPYLDRCRGEETDQQPIVFIILNTFCLLCLIFIVLIVLRTRENLRKLQEQHTVNLPSSNALTYLDTLILCLLIFLSFFFRACILIAFKLSMNQWENLLLVNYLFQLILKNIVIMFLFPIYIILKTRRYLPRLWDDNSPVIAGNNDFYASRLSQISSHVETAESRC